MTQNKTPIEQAIHTYKNKIKNEYMSKETQAEYRFAIEALERVGHAMQTDKSAVDVEGLKQDCVSALVKKEQEHIKSKALQKYSSFIKMQGEFEYFVRKVVDHLHEQGHLTLKHDASKNPEKLNTSEKHVKEKSNSLQVEVIQGLGDAIAEIDGSDCFDGIENMKPSEGIACWAEQWIPIYKAAKAYQALCDKQGGA